MQDREIRTPPRWLRLPSTNADIGSRRASLLHLRLPAALGTGQRYIEPASLVADGGRVALQSFRNRSNASPRSSQSPQPSFVVRGPGLRELHFPFAFSPSSTRRRTATDRVVAYLAAHSSIAVTVAAGMREDTIGSRPVAGRPGFLFWSTFIDFFMN